MSVSTSQALQLTAAFAGRYRVEREIGAGGMATVYLAADVKHDRLVAIKVLKRELAAVLGADRFVVEIKTTASLQHPHILPLFDSGTVDGLPFYVMPYVEGETIRDRLNRETQLGVDDAVRITREVADALDYAHRHGVIHRDIKPENVLLHDGRAMVMDFGIALAVSAAAGGRMTETGLSLGTPHYMSPEQATADKEITGRSDIYSLASVLYEMLTGQPPHLGGSAQQIIMRIIADPAPPVTKFRKSAPPNVAAALAKALEKLPADRFENARSFSDALVNPAFTISAATDGAGDAVRFPSASMRVLAASVIAATLVGIGFGWALRRPTIEPDAPVVRVPVDLQPGERIYTGAGVTLAISPSGDRIVYVAQLASSARLMMRRTGETTAREIASASSMNQPAFSRDGRWIAYTEGNQIKKVPADGGSSVVLGGDPTMAIRGLCWTERDTILVGSDIGIFAIPSQGGALRRLAGVDSTRVAAWPVLLPDGKTIAYVSQSRRLAVTSLSSHRTTVLNMGVTMVLGMLEGRLLFVNSAGDLNAVPFDPEGQRTMGDPIQLENGIRTGAPAFAFASLSANGSLWYLGGQSTGYLMRAVDRREARLLPDMRAFKFPRLSPDGRKVAVEVATANGTSIWLFDFANNTFTSLASNGSLPEWTGDGKSVLFRVFRDGKYAVWSQPADGSAKAELFYQPAEDFMETIVSPDGKWLIYRTAPGAHNRDIYAVPLDGERKPVLLVGGPAQESHPRLSPDGKWLAYQSNESGRFEIYVRPFPGGGARVVVSNQGGSEPIWAGSGRGIFYRTLSGGVDLADVTPGAVFTVGRRRGVLPPADYLTDITHASYDAWPEGGGFLMVKPIGTDDRPILVHNWRRVLRQKLATETK